MFTRCQQYLMDTVVAAGGKTPQTSLKRLQATIDSRVTGVLFEEETLEKDKSKRVYQTPEGKHRRTKKYSRELTFTVVLGDYTPEDVELVYGKFLSLLEDGIYIDGNWVSIEPSRAEWVTTEDSILKAKCAVQVAVKFIGGVYQDTDFAKVSGVTINAGKE